MEKVMENKNSDQEIFHMGSPDEITIKELVKTVGNLMGYRGEYVSAPTYPGSVSRRCPDITKSKQQLGYSPKIFWRNGLKETVAWYKDYFESGKPIQSGGFKPPENLSYNQKQFNNDTEAFI